MMSEQAPDPDALTAYLEQIAAEQGFTEPPVESDAAELAAASDDGTQ